MIDVCFVFLAHFILFIASCQCQSLPGKNCLQNDLLLVERDRKVYSLTHWCKTHLLQTSYENFLYAFVQKAGGDVKKAGKPDPFAYVPLQHQYLNKRYIINFVCVKTEMRMIISDRWSVFERWATSCGTEIKLEMDDIITVQWLGSGALVMLWRRMRMTRWKDCELWSVVCWI